MSIAKVLIAGLIAIALVLLLHQVTFTRDLRAWFTGWLDRVEEERRRKYAVSIEWPVGDCVTLSERSHRIGWRERHEARRAARKTI